MEELVKDIADLERLAAELSGNYEQMQAAAEAFSAAVTTGEGDLDQLGFEASEASKVYDEVRSRSVEFMRSVQKRLRAEARTARKRGVAFPKHAAERSLSKEPDKYSMTKLLSAIKTVNAGMQALIEAVKAFDTLQKQIGETLERLKSQLARLERLDAKSADDIEALESLETRFTGPDEPREELLSDMQTLVATWHERAEDILERKNRETYTELKSVLARLDALKATTTEDAMTLEDLEARLDLLESRELTLDDLQAFLNNCQERAKEARAEMDARSEELAKEAADVLAEIHPEMPEALALHDLLELREALEEPELVQYLAKLETSVTEAHNASLNALKHYEAQIAEDKGYLFTDIREVEQIGTAIVAVAKLPEQYSGRLWAIGEDVMLRVMLAEFDAQGFYDHFGYPAIACALRAALERNEFIQALSFLDTEFLPPKGDSPADRIHALLCQPTIRDLFQEAATVGALRLEPEKFDEMDAGYHKVLLILLGYADDLALPIRVRLQWAAMLSNIVPLESEMHYKVSYLLLMTLLRATHYLSLYYSLKALGARYPDLWDESAFRPMLRHVIGQALVLGTEGRRFLIDLGMAPETAQLAAGDFGSEFLLASLSYYAAVRWGQTALLNEAWTAWDRLAEQYPALAEVLHCRLQGEQLSDSAHLDPTNLRQEYDGLVRRIADLLKMSRYKGVRLAALIHLWYVNEYMEDWLRRLQSEHLSEEQAKRLSAEVHEHQQVEDLVEDCPLQRTPPHPEVKMQPIEGRIKDNVNNRLFEILEIFQQAIKIRQQLLSQAKGQAIPRDALVEELSRICKRSETAAWAIDHLLKPDLSFIANWDLTSIGEEEGI